MTAPPPPPPPPPPEGSTAAVAAPARRALPFSGTLAEFGDMGSFIAEAIRALPGSLRFTSEILRQTGILVVGSTFFIALLAFFIGQTQTTYAYYVTQELGAADYLGAFSGIATPRISTGFTFGLAFAAKVGCGLVAEIGAMRVNEEIDAYESEAVNPMRFIVGTRILAGLLFIPIAAGVAMLANGFGSFVNSVWILQGLEADSFWRFHWALQGFQELLFAMATMAIMAVGIVLVSCFYGYRASGGPAGVGKNVARSLVINLPLVFAVSGLMQFGFYGTDFGLPIGG